MTAAATTAIDLFKQFATDETKEVNGVPTPLEGCGDTKFVIARSMNTAYRRVMRRLLDRHTAALKAKGPEADALMVKIEVEVMSKTILVGWQSTDGKPVAIPFNGEMLEYSTENAAKLLSVKDFRVLVASASENAELYKVHKAEEDEKN